MFFLKGDDGLCQRFDENLVFQVLENHVQLGLALRGRGKDDLPGPAFTVVMTARPS